MKSFSVLMMGVALAACTQPAVQVFHKGSQYYGRDGNGGGAHGIAAMERPRYSDNNRAEQPAQIAAKYRSERHDYAAPATLDSVAVENLAPPDAVSVTEVSAPAEAPQLTPLPIAEPASDMMSVVQEESQPPTLEPLNDRRSNFIWPVEGKVISRFGPKPGGMVNEGINIEAPEGEPVWAAAKGEVAYAGNELKGYGNMMIIRHDNGWMTAYAHTSDMLVDKGDTVNQGDLIGYVGKTGGVTTAQLHFGIRDGKRPVDPETLLPKRVASVE